MGFGAPNVALEHPLVVLDLESRSGFGVAIWIWIVLALGAVTLGVAIWLWCRRPVPSPADEAEAEPFLGGRDPVPRSVRYDQLPGGVLQANVDAEQMELGHSYMFVYSRQGMAVRHTKMIHYDVERTTGWSALVALSGTCVADVHIWRTCSVYWLVTSLLAVGVHSRGHWFSWANEESAGQLSTATGYLSALLGFMLGLFVSEIISRWWRCRMDCLEALWAALSDVQLFMAVRCPDPADSAVKQTMLRLGLVVHRLVYAEARAQESREHLEHMVQVELLTSEECALLDGQEAKAQLVLVWMGRLMHTLAAKKGWSSDVVLHVEEQLRKARNAVGRVFAYTQAQLPFQYVHLLSFCTLLCNLLLAIKCGVRIGQTPESVGAVLNGLQVVVEPFAYHAFLRLCSELANPFGHDFSDFPGFAYHCHMRAEGLGLQKAGETMPAGLLKLAK